MIESFDVDTPLEIDDDGYPTDETLERIRTWPSTEAVKLFDHIIEAWRYKNYASGNKLSKAERSVVMAEKGDKYLRLATGGWSGHEDILSALRDNHVIYYTRWRLEARGGLHIFQYPEESK